METSPSQPTEERLLALAAEGNSQALGLLFQHFREYLTVLARIQIGRRLQGKVDAADLVQEVFLDAHRQFAQFRGTTLPPLSAWLRKILAGKIAALIRHYCHALSRDISLEQSLEKELESSSDELSLGLATTGTSPSESVARREEVTRLAKALEQINPDYREAILLRQIEGLAFSVVAEKMGKSEDSVQKLWVRGLLALRQYLEMEKK